MTYRTKHARLLRTKLSDCTDFCAYADTHATLQDAWDACDRGDWMAWLLDRADVDKREKVGCLAEVAALALPAYEARYPDDSSVRNCIETCRKYARGEASDADLRKARTAAADATASAAYAAYAARAAYSAAYSAAHSAADSARAAYSAAYSAAHSAADSAYAAYSAAYSAADSAYAAYAATTATIRKQIANVIRAHFPVVPTIKVTP